MLTDIGDGKIRRAFAAMLEQFAYRNDAGKTSGDDEASRRLTFTVEMYRNSIQKAFNDEVLLLKRAMELLV